MSLIRRLALRVGQELARKPAARAKAAQVLVKTQRKIQSVAKDVREEYRKGRYGE